MRLKRFLAFVMAASMIVSTPVMAAGTESAQGTPVVEKVFQTTESEWNGIVEGTPVEVTAAPERVNELKNADITFDESVPNEGVLASKDIRPLEDKEEVQVDADAGELTEVGKYSIEEVDRDTIDVDLTKDVEDKTGTSLILNEENVSDTDKVRVVIVMEGDSIIEDNSKATSNWVTRMKSAVMEAKQNTVASRIERKVLEGEKLDVRYHYTWLLNGIATEVPYGTINEIEAVSGVKDVILQTVYSPAKATVDPYTVADGIMIGRDETWANGYTGEGIRISIIDTGIDDDHQNFGAMSDDKLTEDSATKSTISSVLGQLNATTVYPDLTADDVYRSTKIAYGFNYVDANLTINHSNDSAGDHGTHVAGISAANDLGNGEAVGVAPDAQLYVMKVFGANGGAYTEDLLAAVEDSLILGADVINMSLGSPAGFTSDGEALDAIYGRVSETNTILAVAAGNSSSMGQGNLWGTNTNLASNPDNSVVSSPATYVNATSVASVENIGNKGYYIETAGQKLAYSDGSGYYNAAFVTLAGQEYDYAMVPNFGQSMDDFINAGVEGKIAVVQRGVTAFTEKHQFAQDAGAIACIIYNNVSGTIGMDLSTGYASIPCVAITMKDGEYLAAAKEENVDAAIYVSADKAVLPSDTAYQMSDFSSWGISPDLKIEPDVTAPGGNIYSTLDGGEYGLMSGTSMASPNMAGVAALIMQYAKANYPDMSATELHTFVNTLLVSTADPLAYAEGIDYSPRNQGAGLVNAYNAVSTSAYLTVDGMDVPKVELGDDVAKTGAYTYAFNVTNFGDTKLYFGLETSAQTEGVLYDEYSGKNFMSLTPVALAANTSETSESAVYTYDFDGNANTDTADARQLYLNVIAGSAPGEAEAFRYDLNGNDAVDVADVQAYLDALVGKEVESLNLTEQVLEVPAGETVAVNVAVTVTDEGKTYMDTNFENGIYVEGFTKLTAKSVGGVDLSLPYLAFYGDWTAAPIIDSGFYWETADESDASQYYNVLFTNYANSAEFSWYPGLNPYIEEEFDINNVALSPNWDGYSDYIEDMYVSLLRNAKTLSFTYTDADTGEVYFEDVIGNVPKSFFSDSYAQIIPYVYSWYSPAYDLTDAEGNTLANNTKLNLTVKATLDYDAHESANLSDEWVTPITIDVEAPKLIDSKMLKDEATGKYYMELTVSDNVAIAAVNFLNKAGTTIYAQYPVDKVEQGAECTMTYDVTGLGEQLVVVLGDYAFNESSYMLEAEGNVPNVDKTLLYGYRVYDANYQTDELFGWIGINPETAETTVCSSEYYMDYALTAAAYVGDMIIAADANNDLVAIRPGYWDERTKIASLGTYVTQLAFDATTETLYAYDSENSALVTIDVETGAMTRVTSEFDYFAGVIAMTSANGTLYAIDGSGYLWTVDKTTGNWGETLVNTYDSTQMYPFYSQSMTYDAEANSLYWACYGSSMLGVEGVLLKIDLADNYAITNLGTIAGNAEVVGLLKLAETGYTLPESELTGIKVDIENVSLLAGGTQALNVINIPWYAEYEDEYVWTSDNTAVATVSETGIVTAVAAGTTTIRVATEDGRYTATSEVKVVAPAGELNAFVMYGDTLYNQWISFNAGNTDAFETMSAQDFVTLYAGEYLNGYIYAYSSATELYKINPVTFEKTKISASRSDSYIGDMAYDYSTGFMYGLQMDMYMGMTNLVVIDVLTGDFEVVAEGLVNEYGSSFISLAVSTEGTIYLLSTDGILYTYDQANAVLTKIGYTGYAASELTQSMAYDHNTDELYWAMLSYTANPALLYIDTQTGKALSLGQLDGYSQVAGLHSVPQTVPARAEVAVESVEASVETITLLQNSQTNIPVSVRPYNATDRNVTWTSADTNVAAIENGMLVGKNPGTTTITGTLAGFTVTVNVNVVASTGAISGYIATDLSTYSGQFWGAFKDYDLSAGEGLADALAYNMYAGEYYDGKIYGFGANAETYAYEFYVVDTATYTLEKTILCSAAAPDVMDMAFDYTEGVMYAVAGVMNTYGNTSLYMVDINDGSTYKVADLAARVMTLACTEDGKLYGVDENGALYQINKTTAELSYVGDTGFMANAYQSMTYDLDTGNMYWAQTYNGGMWEPTTAYLLVVDVTDASVINLGMIGTAGCQVTALHTVPEKAVVVGTPSITGVVLDKSSELVGVGDTFRLTAKVAPISVVDIEATFSYASDNEAVATVTADGIVTAVAAGNATITATCGNYSASCVVSVVGEETKLYAVNTTGWETAPLLKTGTIAETVNLPAEAGLSIAKACYNQDGYFYAVDTEGCLWKYTEDMQQIVKIGSVVEQLSNLDVFAAYTEYGTPVAVFDMAANPFTGDVYVIAGCEYYEYYIYKLNLDTAEATVVKMIDIWTTGAPRAFAFISEAEVVIYSETYDEIYKSNITDAYAAEEMLAFVQADIVSGTHFAMTYSTELGQLFIVTEDYYGDGVSLALYKFNLETRKVSKMSVTAFGSELASICMVEGATPVTGAAVETVVEEETEAIVEVVEEPTDPAESTGEVVEEPTDPAESTGEVVEEPTNPAESTGEVVEEPTDPAESTGEVVEEPTDPAESTGEVVEEPIDPAESIEEVVEEIVEETEVQ